MFIRQVSLDNHTHVFVMKRREFLGGTLFGAAALGLTPTLAISELLAQRSLPVHLTAQIGLLFPPLALLRRLKIEGPAGELPLREHGIIPLQRMCPPFDVMDVAVRFSSMQEERHGGLMGEADRQRLAALLPDFLETSYRYRVDRIELTPGRSFWYPFLSGRVAFCRLGLMTRGATSWRS